MSMKDLEIGSKKTGLTFDPLGPGIPASPSDPCEDSAEDSNQNWI